jgi:LacI family transcriptional regulator
MQPTMKDVARLAGVSQPTVSHVINGTASISDSVVKRVNEAIEQLGYVPNAMAKGLKTHRSSIIGILVPDVGIRYYGEMVKAVEALLRKRGFMVFLCNTFYSGQLEREYIQTLIQHNVLGVVSGSDFIDERSVSLLKKHSIPVVMLDSREYNDECINVRVDNEMLARMAVSHLYDVGARVISYCSEPLGVAVLEKRYQYFKMAVEEFGLEFDDKRCFIAQNVYDDYNKMKMGYNIGANILLYDNIDAVFASSDEFAFGIISRLKEHGIEIPSQIQIMGCDNDPFSKLITPQLTTIWQPINKVADIGVSMLASQINGETVESSSVCLEPNIIIRESTLKIPRRCIEA